MMKKILGLCFLFIMMGCTDETFNDVSTNVDDVEFYATLEGSDSRTYVDEQVRMRWTAEDYVTIFKKTTYNRKFMFTGKTGSNAGGFKQISVDDDFWFGYDVDANYAVYPHSDDITLDETDLFLTVNLPSEQTYVENSFGLGANTMVAVSESGQLMFKNVGSFLRIRLYGENTAVSSITLTSKRETIAGEAKITPQLDGFPTCEMTGSGKSIRLTCPTPVTISSNADAPTDFWMVVPPVVLSSGFSITVTNSEGNTQVFDVAKSFTFERNKYYDMAREVSIASDIPYVTFTADEVQTLTMTKAVEKLEYSVGGGEWAELGTSIVAFGGENGNLRLRGKNRYGTASGQLGYSNFTYSTIKFGNVTSVACSGDIRTLLDYENYLTVYTGNAMFSYLFSGCSNLTSAPKLPATDLKASCYLRMFSYCTNLKIAPELPATTLKAYCYDGMFRECKSLIVAPELPATSLAPMCYYEMFYGCSNITIVPNKLPAITLAESCYRYMFLECISLKNAPELPAKSLASYCYSSMFGSCSSLINAPDLPATSLASNCYSSMFGGCNSLTKSPELPATELAESCYEAMFSGCSSLRDTPDLPATNLASRCYHGMFSDCSNLMNTSELPATTLANECYMGMFSGCSSLTNAPQLPATVLAYYCYHTMFSECSSLTNTPDLPATTLADNCYTGMFIGCVSLTKAPELPATTLANECYSTMFSRCVSLTNAPELPATTLASSCYSSMFYGCSSLTNAPELPATTLATSCYSWMFGHCSKLNNITMLATDISASGCLNNWLYGVASTGTFTKAEEMESLPEGSSGIPTNWTVQNYSE